MPLKGYSAKINAITSAKHLLAEEDLHIHTRLDVDGSDLFHNLTWTVKVNHTLVNTHLEAVPGVGTLTIGSLASGDLELLGGKADRARHLEVLAQGVPLDVTAHFLDSLNVG